MQATKEAPSDQPNQFAWKTQPAAARWVTRTIASLTARNPVFETLADKLREVTGTRLVDWVDHFALSDEDSLGLIGELADIGYMHQGQADKNIWRHPAGLFPPVIVNGGRTRLAIRCESVDSCILALAPMLGFDGVDSNRVIGPRGGMFRHIAIDERVEAALWLVERHGYDGFGMMATSSDSIGAAAGYREAFRQRQRSFPEFAAGFRNASELFAKASEEIGTDWACDLFFAAEREYWQKRNRAGAVQYERQNRLGLGWANHDHHTYRSSRAAFPQLIATLEQMGFHCRERFYAGREAGWARRSSSNRRRAW